MRNLLRKTSMKAVAVAVLLSFTCCSCATVQNIQPHVVQPASQLPNSQTISGISVAAQPYVYPGQGLDYTKAGLYPLRVTVTNNSSRQFLLSPEAVVLLGGDGQLYMTYQNQEAAQLVINSYAIQELAKGAASGAVVGAAIGALVILTVGAILHVHPNDSLVGAGAFGGAVGGAQGGIEAYLTRLRDAAQAEIYNNALTKKVIPPGFTASGWLYFPGHVRPQELRIALSEVGAGNFITFRFSVPAAG